VGQPKVAAVVQNTRTILEVLAIIHRRLIAIVVAVAAVDNDGIYRWMKHCYAEIGHCMVKF
jgi:hypothetical protein